MNNGWNGWWRKTKWTWNGNGINGRIKDEPVEANLVLSHQLRKIMNAIYTI